MRAMMICAMAVVLLCQSVFVFGENFSRDYGFEKKLDNLFTNKSENPGEIGEFFKLSLSNDEFIIEKKVDITNYKRQIQTLIAEILAKNDFAEPSDEEQMEINEMWKLVRKYSELEDRIWVIIKSRRLWEEKERKSKLADKSPRSLN